MKALIKAILIGEATEKRTPKLAVQNQINNIKRVWKNKEYGDFGFERILRLFLVLSQFIFPGLYVRHFFGKLGLFGRKIGVECYVLSKLILPLIILFTELSKNKICLGINIYLTLETIIYIFGLIFLSDIYARPISKKRSILMLLINYLEICFEFSVIYYFCTLDFKDFFNAEISKISILYFSFVTSATVGYGDIFIKNELGKFIVISQIVVSFVFVVLFFSFFSTNLNEQKYFTDKNNDKK